MRVILLEQCCGILEDGSWILANPLEILEKIHCILAQWDTLLEKRDFIRKNKIILEDL